MLASQLVNITSWSENIRELDLHGYMTFLLTERQNYRRKISELQTQLESDRRDMEKDRAAPFRWAFKQRFPDFTETLIKLALIALIACGVIAAFR